jgi:hypothetical protein
MDMLDIYTDYLICQNEYATATGLSELLDGEFAHVNSPSNFFGNESCFLI